MMKNSQNLTLEELEEIFSSVNPEEVGVKSEIMTQLGFAKDSQKLTPEELLELLSTVSPGEVDEGFKEKMKEKLEKEIEAQN